MTIARKALMFAVAAGALLLSGAAATAQGWLGGAEWYVKGFGGATFLQDTDVSVRGGGVTLAEGNAKFDTGYTLGAALGANFTPNFAMELEYAHRKSDIDRLRIGGIDLGGEARSDSFMLNALYNFNGVGPGGAWRPYAGAGLGVTEVKLEVEDDDFKRDSILAYQFIGGIAYDVASNVSLYGEARWFATEGGRFSGPGGLSAKADYDTIDLLVGASYSF